MPEARVVGRRSELQGPDPGALVEPQVWPFLRSILGPLEGPPLLLLPGGDRRLKEPELVSLRGRFPRFPGVPVEASEEVCLSDVRYAHFLLPSVDRRRPDGQREPWDEGVDPDDVAARGVPLRVTHDPRVVCQRRRDHAGAEPEPPTPFLEQGRMS